MLRYQILQNFKQINFTKDEKRVKFKFKDVN